VPDAKVASLVLPSTAVAGTDPVNLPGFPGIWIPGVPVAVSAVAQAAGLTDKELLKLAAERGVPLDTVDVASPEPPPVPANHVQAAVPTDLIETEPDNEESLMRLKRDELDERARAAGVEAPETLGTKQEVVDALVALDAPNEPGPVYESPDGSPAPEPDTES